MYSRALLPIAAIYGKVWKILNIQRHISTHKPHVGRIMHILRGIANCRLRYLKPRLSRLATWTSSENRQAPCKRHDIHLEHPENIYNNTKTYTTDRRRKRRKQRNKLRNNDSNGRQTTPLGNSIVTAVRGGAVLSCSPDHHSRAGGDPLEQTSLQRARALRVTAAYALNRSGQSRTRRCAIITPR